MNQYTDFLLRHWMLSAAFLAILTLLIANELKEALNGLKRLSPQQVTNMMNREGALCVDVRSETDYNAGHILGSIHIDKDQIDDKIETLGADKSKAVIVVCYAGVQAVNSAKKIKRHGFTNVHLLHEGMRGWNNANLPLNT